MEKRITFAQNVYADPPEERDSTILHIQHQVMSLESGMQDLVAIQLHHLPILVMKLRKEI